MSVAEIRIANLYGGGVSVAGMMIADSFELMMWSDPLIAMTCADTPSFVESYGMFSGPFLKYVSCLGTFEVNEGTDVSSHDEKCLVKLADLKDLADQNIE